MLKEIKCEKFTDRIKDKTVHFAPGLNCIVGADDAVNSIGKSSLLLIIDFCFGGTDYAENRADVIENVGDHTICFTFEFDSIQFHFSRNVSDSNFYFECDKFYSPIGEKKPIKELQRFLKERYFGSSIQSSFRNVINVFSRVYGKENYDVNKPLKTFGRDAKDENGIKVLLDLFGRLGELNEAISNIKTAKDGKKALDDAKKFGFIFSPIKTASEYDETLAAVQRLKDDLDSLVKDENAAKVVIDEKLSQKDIDLKSKQIVLMRRKRALSIQLNTFESMTGDNLMMSIDDKEKLLAEFPNYDVRPLLEINEFQRQLSKNVNEQINEQKEIVKKEIAEIDRQLKEVNDELLENDISPRISKAFLTAVLEKNEEIKKLESQIALYSKTNSIKEKIENAKADLDKRCSCIFPEIEGLINDELKKLNDCIYSEKRLPPALKLADISRYTYKTPRDTGTGTEYKSLILFDLAILRLTSLPFIINDSMLFKNIWDEPVEGLFRLYDQENKQIFLAIDRVGAFCKEVQEIIERRKSVKLGDGNCALFGFVWSKVNETSQK